MTKKLDDGGARGLAHIGVIRWLRDNGYQIRSIVDRVPARGLLDVAFLSMQTMHDTITRLKLRAHTPDVTIEIPRNACGFHEFWRAQEIIELGRKRAAQALDEAGQWPVQEDRSDFPGAAARGFAPEKDRFTIAASSPDLVRALGDGRGIR